MSSNRIRSILLLSLLLSSIHLSGQVVAPTGSIEQSIQQSNNPQPGSEAIVTTAELQLPKAVILRRITNDLTSQTRAVVQRAVFSPYKRPLNAMFMWTSTQNFVAKFIDNSGTVGNSDIFDNSGLVGIGTSNPQATLHVAGNNSPGLIVEAYNSIEFGTTVCCGAGQTGSSIGSSSGFSSFYNGVFFNNNGTAAGGAGGAQINTALPSWRMALGSGTSEWPGGDNFAIARVAAAATYGSPTVLFSLANNGRMKVAGGVDNTGTGIKHARVGGCSGGTSPCSVTVSWPGTAFPDTNYTAVCSPDSSGQGTFSITAKSTSSVTVTLSPITVFVSGIGPGGAGETASSFNLAMSGVECIAMHD